MHAAVSPGLTLRAYGIQKHKVNLYFIPPDCSVLGIQIFFNLEHLIRPESRLPACCDKLVEPSIKLAVVQACSWPCIGQMLMSYNT